MQQITAPDNFEMASSAVAPKLAGAIKTLGQAGFDNALLDLVASFIGFDSALVLLYSTGRRPAIVVDRLKNTQRTNSADGYVGGAYLLDPFYRYAQTATSPEMVRISEITATRFDETDYFVSYYGQSGIVDEFNYLVPLPNRRIYAVSVGRSAECGSFGKDDLSNGRRALPVIAELVAKHTALRGGGPLADEADAEHERLEVLLRQFGATVLTPRECEVVQLMLNGYSMLAIGKMLGVSIETARVHRRHIYDKLKISSLAELFSLALKAIYSAKRS